MIRPHYWELFSKKTRDKIERPRFAGSFIHSAEGLRLVMGREESSSKLKVCFYWIVDETDGVIADAKFQAFGPVGLIAAAEAASELALRKNYDQASRISADLIDRHMRDKKDTPAFPKECYGHLNMVLSAMDRAIQQCLDIPFQAAYDTTPIENDYGEVPGGIQGWGEMSSSTQLRIIEEVIEKEIRPYVELDAGNVKVVRFTGSDVLISYEGSCTSCPSSTGSTLTAIQQILRARVHPDLRVIPQLTTSVDL